MLAFRSIGLSRKVYIIYLLPRDITHSLMYCSFIANFMLCSKKA